jgi:LuxR family transcriptional activator of conjugal transfer of Ti plasmids
MHRHWISLMDALHVAKNKLQVEAALSSLIASLGIKYYAFASLLGEKVFFVSNYPREWQERYILKRYIHSDPFLSISRMGGTSVRWSTDDFKPQTPTQEQLIAEGRTFGIRSGATLAVHLPYGHMGALTLASDTKRMKEMMAGHIPSIAVTIGSIDAILRRISLDQCLSEKVSLSLRQTECLEWSSRGKTAAETALILGISESAVTWHLKEARAKLNANNLPHAVRLAMEQGLVAV